MKITKYQEKIENIETIHDRIATLVSNLAKGKNTLFAKLIGSNEGNIRGYIKGVIPKQDVLEKIVINLDVNPDWLLTGNGPMLKDRINRQTQILQDNGDLNTFNQRPEETQKSELIKQLMDRISQQAEEIGRLKERIENTKDSKLKSASDAEEDIAHVG